MGYIIDGVYYRGKAKPELIKGKTSVNKQWDHDRQREDHQADIVQMYDRDGTVNREFVELYPEVAKDKGLIKEDTWDN